MNEGRWVTISGRRVFIRTNEHPMNAFIKQKSKLQDIKTQKDKIKYINETYKDILRFPIDAIKVKNYDTGDQKTGKYHWEYTATLKPTNNSKVSENIFSNSLEELDERLSRKRNI